jgi:hypothetical protein
MTQDSILLALDAAERTQWPPVFVDVTEG